MDKMRLLRAGPSLRSLQSSGSSGSRLPRASGVAAFSNTQTQQKERDDQSEDFYGGFAQSTSAHDNIDEVSRSGLEEVRHQSHLVKEQRKHVQRQADQVKHTTDHETKAQPNAFEAPYIESAPGADMYPEMTTPSADPFAERPPPTFHLKGSHSQSRRTLLSRVDNDLLVNPPRSPHHNNAGSSEGRAGQHQGNYQVGASGSSYASRGQGPSNAGRGFKAGPGAGTRTRNDPRIGNIRMPARSAGPAGRGRGGGAAGGRGGRGGRGGPRGRRNVPGLGAAAAAISQEQLMQAVVQLPPPLRPSVNHTFKGLFGSQSVLQPPVQGHPAPEEQWWAKDMSPFDARKSEVLRLAGSYDTMLPALPRPTDPKVASDPKAKAKSLFMWTNAMKRGAGYEQARLQEERLDKAMR